MPLKIRLARHGAKKKPFYRIIVANSEAPRDGRFSEILGTYDPRTQPSSISLNMEAVDKWLATGAIPTDTAKNLISRYRKNNPVAVTTDSE